MRDDRRIQHSSDVELEIFSGPRSELLPLFALADDSAREIASYIDKGDVLVARKAEAVAGHVQTLACHAGCEIKSLAVLPDQQRRGIGGALVQAAVAKAFAGGATRVVVSTASADIDNLRFYQRHGFRMDRVERDVFTLDRGYAEVEVDGIPVRDRVWLSLDSPPRV